MSGAKRRCSSACFRFGRCLWEEVRPSSTSFDPESPERDRDRYEAVQSLLGNIMTVSTLLLGFIITGTMLSVRLTGNENFGTGLLLQFLRYTLLATVSALISVVLAFRMAQALTVAFQRSTDMALRELRRGTLCVALSELMLYGSLLSFLASIPVFLEMQQLGPKICPTMDLTCADHCDYNDLSNAAVHDSASCSSLGYQLFGVAKGRCLSAKRNRTRTLCNFYDLYVAGNPTNYTAKENQAAWFAWDTSPIEIMDLAVGEAGILNYWQTVTTQAIALACEVELAAELKETACAGDQGTQASRQACASASSYTLHAGSCASSSADSADQCRKVCGWVRVKDPNRLGVPPAYVVSEWCNHYIWSCFALVLAIVSLRLVCPLVEAGMILVAELRSCIGDGLGALDDESTPSESEETPETPGTPHRISLATGPFGTGRLPPPRTRGR